MLFILVCISRGYAQSTPAITIEGQLMDSAADLLRALGLTEHTPLRDDQIEKIRQTLGTLGYQVQLKRQGHHTTLHLTPFRLVRKIYIKGNWPLPEEEITRRLYFRSGARLLEGAELAHALALQEERIKQYLSREGYFEGSLQTKVIPDKEPYHVNLEVRINTGRQFKVGKIQIQSKTSSEVGASLERRKPALAISHQAIADTFIHRILFYKRSFTTAQFQKDVETLNRRFHELDYPGVRIKENYWLNTKLPPSQAVRIKLDIQQKKRIVIRFQGNHQLSEKNLREVLTFHEEGTYDDYAAGQSARAIHRLYQSRGYLQARVQFRREIGTTEDTITYSIEEGPCLKVYRIDFVGNSHVSDDDLREVIRTRPFPLLGYISLGEGGYLTDTQLQQDAERIGTLYREKGFNDVQVRAQVAPHPMLFDRPGALAAFIGTDTQSDGRLYVRFKINEGKQILVENVMIHGNQVIDSTNLLSQLALKAGQPITENALSLDKARLVRIYSEGGYPYATVGAMEELSADEKQETIQFSIQENQLVRFGPVFIRGNFKTQRSVILGDLPFKEGDIFDIRRIEMAESRMRQRQIFKMVRVQLIGIAEKREVLPVLINVEERYDDYGAIELSVGYSTDNLLLGSVGYTNTNLFGFGTDLGLKLEYGMRIQSGTAFYRDPFLFGSSFSFMTDGFLRHQITDRLGEVSTWGLSTGVSKELWRNLMGSLRFEFRQTTHKEDLIRPPGIDEFRQIDIFTKTSGFVTSLVYDRRDNKLNPSRGFRLGSSIMWATKHLLGSDDFLKLNANGQALIPLVWGTMISLSLRYDHGIPFGGAVTLPKVERFFAGGDTTIRGFEDGRAWTERIEIPMVPYGTTSLYRMRPQGGNIRFLSNVEFQFPILKRIPLLNWPIMGAIFFDNGFVTNSWQGFDISKFRDSVGLAFLRLVSPVGLVSFEYAFPLDPDIGDQKDGRLHFNFGFIF